MSVLVSVLVCVHYLRKSSETEEKCKKKINKNKNKTTSSLRPHTRRQWSLLFFFVFIFRYHLRGVAAISRSFSSSNRVPNLGVVTPSTTPSTTPTGFSRRFGSILISFLSFFLNFFLLFFFFAFRLAESDPLVKSKAEFLFWVFFSKSIRPKTKKNKHLNNSKKLVPSFFFYWVSLTFFF